MSVLKTGGAFASRGAMSVFSQHAVSGGAGKCRKRSWESSPFNRGKSDSFVLELRERYVPHPEPVSGTDRDGNRRLVQHRKDARIRNTVRSGPGGWVWRLGRKSYVFPKGKRTRCYETYVLLRENARFARKLKFS